MQIYDAFAYPRGILRRFAPQFDRCIEKPPQQPSRHNRPPNIFLDDPREKKPPRFNSAARKKARKGSASAFLSHFAASAQTERNFGVFLKFHIKFFDKETKKDYSILNPRLTAGGCEGIKHLSNTYALVKEEICALLKDGAQLEASPSHIFCAPDAFEAATALPLALQLPAEFLAQRLCAYDRAQPRTLYGAPLFKSVAHSEGRLCFTLTDAFFASAIRETNAASPLPALPPRVESRAEYALSRMLMLARKGGSGCTEGAKRMVWAALGVSERLSDAKALKIRLMLAAEHALSFGTELPMKERMALYNASGEAAACTARCIALGLGTLFTAERPLEA